MLPKSEILCVKFTLPVSGEECTVRAMTTREEKILLIAKTGEDQTHTNFALHNLVDACTEFTKSTSNAKSVPTTDLIALFLKIVEISKGSIVTHKYICNNTVTDSDGSEHKCGSDIDVVVDITDVKYERKKEQDPLVQLPNGMFLKLRWVNTQIVEDIAAELETEQVPDNAIITELQIRTCARCIEYIMSGDEVYNEFTIEEIYDWILNQPSDVVNIITEYLDTMPTATLEYDIVCPKCGATYHVVLKDLADFFTNDMPVRRL